MSPSNLPEPQMCTSDDFRVAAEHLRLIATGESNTRAVEDGDVLSVVNVAYMLDRMADSYDETIRMNEARLNEKVRQQ